MSKWRRGRETLCKDGWLTQADDEAGFPKLGVRAFLELKVSAGAGAGAREGQVGEDALVGRRRVIVNDDCSTLQPPVCPVDDETERRI